MSVDNLHAEYARLKPLWDRSRDFIDGETKVKKKGEAYLRRLIGQEDDDYESYKENTNFLNAAGRTRTALVGTVFLKDPVVKLPKQLEAMEKDADLCGNTLKQYAQSLTAEILAVGRGATLVEWSEADKRTHLNYYDAEAVLNWRYERVNDRWMLTMVVLREFVAMDSTEYTDANDRFLNLEVERIRVLELDRGGNEPQYVVNVFERTIKDGKDAEWVKVNEEPIIPTRGAKPLAFIPIVFHGPSADARFMDKPPLDDLIALNLSHYRLSADHYRGLHYAATPTAWVAGFKTDTQLRVGATVAWVTENPDAKAGYLEFTGAGLGAMRIELDRIEQSMAVIGARMLEPQKKSSETAEAMTIRQSGEEAVLAGIVNALSATLTVALRIAAWWQVLTIEAPGDIPKDDVSIDLNSDFGTAKMTGQELTALVSTWQMGAISRRTMFYNLQQGEIIPPNVSYEDELELIDAEGPKPGMELDDPENPDAGNEDEDPDKGEDKNKGKGRPGEGDPGDQQE